MSPLKIPQKDTNIFQYINAHNDVLMLIGVDHFNNSDNTQLPKLLQKRQEWCQATLGQRRIMLLEGMIRNNLPRTEQEALRARGEMAMMSVWGDLTNIPRDSLERPQQWQVDNLLRQGHDLEVIKYYYSVRMIPQAYRASKATGIKINMVGYLKEVISLHKRLEWTCVSSLEELIGIHNTLYPQTPFNPDDGEFFTEQTIYVFDLPDSILTPLQRVTKSCHADRREHMIDHCTSLMQYGTSVLALFGEPHFETVAKAIDKRSLERINNTFWSITQHQPARISHV